MMNGCFWLLIVFVELRREKRGVLVVSAGTTYLPCCLLSQHQGDSLQG